ncbi:unnamed protein product [Eruca vesicaria subsp. sativa]|uniref:BZIP domain-containing protein n=1 Tax=Eruca vesicaria subsp. sativa TaxID=29727 RepID=A0ABC8LHP8_ERUVS|nr:unnamed protein product [Eruca vesicaria subsp. sativa]
MSLDGLGGMAMAEAYTARKFHRENMKTLTASTATTVGGGNEDNGGGYSRWFFGKLSIKKSSAKMMSSSSSSTTTQAVAFRDMGMYEPFQQLSGWENTFNTITNNNNQSTSIVHEVDAARTEANDNNKGNYTCLYNNSVEAEPSSNNDQDDVPINDKMKRRLAQNREAARKSRLRKKAHVQQLEESRLKLSQLEQELARARQQGLCVRNPSDTSYLGPAGTMNTGIAAFEMEHKHWLEEQNKRVSEIRTALQAHISDIELKWLQPWRIFSPWRVL